jgi:hypothetical protein
VKKLVYIMLMALSSSSLLAMDVGWFNNVWDLWENTETTRVAGQPMPPYNIPGIATQPILAYIVPDIEIISPIYQSIDHQQVANLTKDLIQAKMLDDLMMSCRVQTKLIDCSPKGSVAVHLHNCIKQNWFDMTYRELQKDEKLRRYNVLGRRLWKVLFKKIISREQFYEGLDCATLPENTRGIADAFAYLGLNNVFLGISKEKMMKALPLR